MTPERRRTRERGSALLIVFVFAAIIAIMLYREMPVAAFEAQRQKEELLIDRGNEYKRAVKLYVRKLQTFPASLDALENTNRMRFLRFRYVDPYTGKADWRLLHAGPGGIIIDSKIKLPGADSNSGNDSTSAKNGTAASNPFGSPDPATSSNPAAAPVAGFPQRPPAVALNGGTGAANSDLPPLPADTSQPPADAQPVSVPYPGYPGPPTGPVIGPTSSGSGPSPSGPVNPLASSSNGFPLPPSRYNSSGPQGNSYPPGQFGGAPAGGSSQDPQSMMNSLLGSQNPQSAPQTGIAASAPTPSANSSSGSNNALTAGGGIAGVASKASGHTIKVINDQTERTLWEFVYDMKAEAAANAPGLGNANTAPGTQGNANQNAPAAPAPSSNP